MGLHPHNRSDASCLGLAVARALARRHPVHTAKMIARELSSTGTECTVRTAENILQGHLSARTLTRLVDAYGLGLLLEAAGLRQGMTLDETLEAFIEDRAAKARREAAAWGERVRTYEDRLGQLQQAKAGAASAGRGMAGRVV